MASSRRSLGARGDAAVDRDHALDRAPSRNTISAIASVCARVEDAERALPGLFFCANYRGGVSVGDCIKSAHAMADTVTRFLAAAP